MPSKNSLKRQKKNNAAPVDGWAELHEDAASEGGSTGAEAGTDAEPERALSDILADDEFDEEHGKIQSLSGGEEEYSQLQQPDIHNETMRLRTLFWEDQTYAGKFNRAMYRLWQFILSFQSLLGGLTIVVATVIGMNVQLLENGSLDTVNFVGMLTGAAVVVLVELLKFANLSCSKKTIFELDYHGHAKKKVVFDDSHVVTKMHFFTVFLLMTFFCYAMLSLRNACIVGSSEAEGGNPENCLFLDNLIDRLGWGHHPLGGNTTLPVEGGVEGGGGVREDSPLVSHWDRSP